jgi:hypothetical protein
MSKIEERLAAVEARITRMENKRRELLGDLDNDPNVKVVLRDSIDGFRAKLQSFAEQKNVDAATTRFNAARQKAFEEFERLVLDGKLAEDAKDCAAVLFVDKHGFAPPGYAVEE